MIQKWNKPKKDGDKSTIRNRHKDCSQTITDLSGVMAEN